jgi:hypothetical protein
MKRTMESLLAEWDEKWQTAEAEWKALPEAEKIRMEEAADAEAAKADVSESINHWTTLPRKPLNLDSSGTFIRKLREIRDGYHTKTKALTLFDMAYDDLKNDIRRKIYHDWAKSGLTPEHLTPDQLCWIFSRTPTIDKNSEGIIAGIRAQIESMTEPAPDKQAPEQRAALPPVIRAILDEGLLDDTPERNSKYRKKGDKKDGDIIKWIFDYSGYEDDLTVELYMQYIQTACKPTTISDYIRRDNNLRKEREEQTKNKSR